MEDYVEIDIRKVIKNLLAHWLWILLPTLLVGAAVYLYLNNQPRRYEARASFMLSDPAYQVSLTGEIRTTAPRRPSQDALKTLMLNDQIVTVLFDLWDCDPDVKENCSLNAFRGNKLNVITGPDMMLVTLVVEGQNPENNALLANTWADLAVEAVNTTFYGLQQEQLDFFDQQTANARRTLDQAEADLVSFAETDPRVGLSNQLDTLITSQREKLRQIRSLEEARADLINLFAQLDAKPAAAALDPVHRFSLTLIQTRVYSGFTWESAPIQLLVDINENPENQTVGDFQDLVTSFLAQIENRVENLQGEQAELTQPISTLRAEIRAIDNQESALQSEHARRLKIYELSASKLEEVSLTFEANRGSGATIIQRVDPAQPGQMLARNTVRNTALAAAVTGMLAVAGVILVDWWQDDEKQPTKDEPRPNQT